MNRNDPTSVPAPQNDAPPDETGEPSTDPTPAGDVPTLRKLAADEGAAVPQDSPVERDAKRGGHDSQKE